MVTDHLQDPADDPSWRRICLLDIRSVSALEVSRIRTLQINIYLLTYLLE